MQFYTTILATIFITSALANAIPDVADELFTGNEAAVIEDGVPDFDPAELSGPPPIADEQKRDFDDDEEEETSIEKRSVASNIVAAAAKLKGTNYLWGGCKAAKPFGPAKGGLDCSCLSKTAIYRGTKTVLPRTSAQQYTTKVGKCHQINRKSAKAGDLVFWGCGQKGGVHHVAVVSKPGWIWHAPKPGKRVSHVKIWPSGICSKAVRCW